MSVSFALKQAQIKSPPRTGAGFDSHVTTLIHASAALPQRCSALDRRTQLSALSAGACSRLPREVTDGDTGQVYLHHSCDEAFDWQLRKDFRPGAHIRSHQPRTLWVSQRTYSFHQPFS